MAALLKQDPVHPVELKNFEQAYYEQLRLSEAAGELARTRFEYAWCLVRSEVRVDITRGILILEDLCATIDDEARRDYLFYLAVATTKLGDYQRAQECCAKLLAVEPNDRQAQELLQLVKQRKTREGLKGLAVACGAALVVIGILGLGMALAKK